jgi:hypothetical protein
LFHVEAADTTFQVDAAGAMFQVDAAETLFQVDAAWLELVAVTEARTTTSMRAMAAKSAIKVREVVRRAVMALLQLLGD